MITITGSFDDVDAKVGGGGSARPACKGYKMKIMSAEVKTSKSGNIMLVLEMDIADGPSTGYFGKYPLKYFRPFPDAEGVARLKGDVMLIATQNVGLMKENPFVGGSFDEQSLVGKHVGGVLKHDGDFLKLNFITTIEKALAAPVIPEPAKSTTASTSGGTKREDDLPF